MIGSRYGISVLISTYNDGRLLPGKIEEIRRQTIFDRAEFIFIETASPTRERNALRPFVESHRNCRLIVLEDRKTIYEAWNLGWRTAESPLICYSNMDDCMHPRLLESVVRGMQRGDWDLCSVLIAKQRADDPQLNNWNASRLRSLALSTRPGPFTSWRSDVREKIGDFDGRLLVAGDKDFWSRAQARRLSIGLVPRVLYLYTKSHGQLSKRKGRIEPKANDAPLLAAKPYEVVWPSRIRWRVFWIRVLLRVAPGLFCEG